MANLKQQGFRPVMPTLKASDLQGASNTVVTIVSAEPVPGQGRRKQLLLMKFKEWPDKVYFPNPTGISELMKGLGDETNSWHGQQIALQVALVQNPETKEDVEALHVAPSDKWESHIKAATKKGGR